MQHTTVIYEGTPGRRLHTERIDIVGATSSGIERALQQAVDEGSHRIELCGGISAPRAARAQDVVPERVQLRLLRYGFESLERIADYKRAFAAGDVRPAVFLYPEAGGAEPVEHPDVTILPVRDLAHAERLGARFAAEGIGLVELYGGLGVDAASAVLRGADSGVPVGFVDL